MCSSFGRFQSTRTSTSKTLIYATKPDDNTDELGGFSEFNTKARQLAFLLVSAEIDKASPENNNSICSSTKLMGMLKSVPPILYLVI